MANGERTTLIRLFAIPPSLSQINPNFAKKPLNPHMAQPWEPGLQKPGDFNKPA